MVPGFDHLHLIGSAPELAAHMAKTTGGRILNAEPTRDTESTCRDRS